MLIANNLNYWLFDVEPDMRVRFDSSLLFYFKLGVTNILLTQSVFPSQFVHRIWYELSNDSYLGDYPVIFAETCAGYFISFGRMLIAIVFVLSFVFQPLVKQPLSLIWLRIVESDKPIFTLVFGGVASIATAISQVAKHLS